METTYIEYPALVYKSDKNNVFVANCICKKLIGFGKTEQDAVANLEQLLNSAEQEYFIRVTPRHALI